MMDPWEGGPRFTSRVLPSGAPGVPGPPQHALPLGVAPAGGPNDHHPGEETLFPFMFPIVKGH